MIVSKSQVQNILKIYGTQSGNNRVNKTTKTPSGSKEDHLAISSESRIKQKAMQAAKQAEDIRMDKIKDLQERISTGTYTVSDNEVAEKMIERAIVDELV